MLRYIQPVPEFNCAVYLNSRGEKIIPLYSSRAVKRSLRYPIEISGGLCRDRWQTKLWEFRKGGHLSSLGILTIKPPTSVRPLKQELPWGEKENRQLKCFSWNENKRAPLTKPAIFTGTQTPLNRCKHFTHIYMHNNYR